MPPKSNRQLRGLIEKKKKFIMDSALIHFAKTGYHKTTIKHLARHAGISTGLLYNYFDSKEDLLNQIVVRSLKDISVYLDTGKNDFLTGEEFELFIRKFFQVLKENKSFWQLFFQMTMQKEVRELILNYFTFPVMPADLKYPESRIALPLEISKTIIDYFKRKKEKMPEDYDAIMDMKMFIYTIEGFAMISVFLDKTDDEYYEKTINKIVEQYK